MEKIETADIIIWIIVAVLTGLGIYVLIRDVT
jgi:hypothetical protein